MVPPASNWDRSNPGSGPLGHRICFLLGIGGMMLACLLVAPVMVPIGSALNVRERRRVRRFAAALRCSACGRPVGAAGVDLAARRHREIAAQWRKDHPGTKFPFVEKYNAECPGCGTLFMIDAADGTAEQLSPAEAAYPRG